MFYRKEQRLRAKIDLNNLDCLPVLKKMSDNQFDLAIVDPPYGIGIAKKKSYHLLTWTKYESKDWDNAIPTAEYFTELKRVSKNQIIFGGNYFTDFLKPSKCWIVWDKMQPEGADQAMCELIWTSFDTSSKIYIQSVQTIGNKVSGDPFRSKLKMRIHPTQKPVELYKWLLGKYAKAGDRILDTHSGSGSIAIACWDLKFDLTAYEIDKEYFDKANQRLETHKKQLHMF